MTGDADKIIDAAFRRERGPKVSPAIQHGAALLRDLRRQIEEQERVTRDLCGVIGQIKPRRRSGA